MSMKPEFYMMSDREKLIELIESDPCGTALFAECDLCKYVNEASCFGVRFADHLLANGVTFATDANVGDKWISVEDEKPKGFVSVLGHMTDAGDFPAVRECYWTGDGFFFPALCERHPVDRWMEMPK